MTSLLTLQIEIWVHVHYALPAGKVADFVDQKTGMKEICLKVFSFLDRRPGISYFPFCCLRA